MGSFYDGFGRVVLWLLGGVLALYVLFIWGYDDAAISKTCTDVMRYACEVLIAHAHEGGTRAVRVFFVDFMEYRNP